MHVLLVDDAPELIRLFSIILDRHTNFVVTTCAKEFDTLADRIDWDTIDVAVVDQFLGHYDGKVLLGWLAEHHPSIRRIMLTGDHRVDPRIANAELVLLKPVDGPTLIGAIEG